MRLQTKKRKVLKEIVSYMYENKNLEKAFYKLLNLLLDEANNGKLYKYRSFDEKQYWLDSLKNGTLYCPCVSCLNDPFEFEIGLSFGSLFKKNRKKNMSKYIDVLKNIRNYMNVNLKKSIFVGCLTTEYKNKLMWSHYADNHKGFCVEYDFSAIDKEGFYYYILPVLYNNKRVQFPIHKINKKKEVYEFAIFESIIYDIVTKEKIWEYENEWRILVNASDGNKIVMPKISCIYLGMKITDENKKRILEIAKEKGIPVKQMKIRNSVYGLKEEDVFVP